MTEGTKVRMSAKLKESLSRNDSAEHVREFGNCIGVVLGPTDYKSCLGPEVDVRWLSSNLRYAYHPDDLEVCLLPPSAQKCGCPNVPGDHLWGSDPRCEGYDHHCDACHAGKMCTAAPCKFDSAT